MAPAVNIAPTKPPRSNDLSDQTAGLSLMFEVAGSNGNSVRNAVVHSDRSCRAAAISGLVCAAIIGLIHGRYCTANDRLETKTVQFTSAKQSKAKTARPILHH